MILRALIVDDEYPARQELRYLLEQLNNIEIVGEAAGATEALKLINALEYDVLFLDINLPGMNGLELAEVINSLKFKIQVVFISAYENFALDAFKVNATDYLLKPIEIDRLKQAIDKVMYIKSRTIELESNNENNDFEPNLESVKQSKTELSIDRIIAESNGRMILVDFNDIIYAFTEDDRVYLKTFSERLFTRLNLKDLEERLSCKCFFRTHRSFLVNLSKVKEIQPLFNGTYSLLMDDKEKSEIPVSRSQAQKFKNLYGKSLTNI